MRNGRKGNGLQNHKCSDCGRQFTALSASFWAGMRFPPKAVIGCMALKFIGHSSYLAILTLLAFFCGVHVGSTGTLWEWVKKCETAFEMVHHTYKKSYGRKAWRIDEIFCRLKGNISKKNCAYVYVVSDNKDNILAMHVSLTRDSAAVERLLAKIADKEARAPPAVVTDKHRGYLETLAFNLPGAVHVRTGIRGKTVRVKKKRRRFTINPHERLNGTIQSWLRPMKGFKTVESGNRMVNMYRICHTAGKQIGHGEFLGRLASLP